MNAEEVDATGVGAETGSVVDAVAAAPVVGAGVPGGEGTIASAATGARAGEDTAVAAVIAPRPTGRGAGGGRLREGRSAAPRPSRRTFLRAAIS